MIDTIILKLKNMDWNKWTRNSLVFFAPFIVIFLTAVQSGATYKEALNVLYLYILNVVIDLLKKYKAA